MVHSAIKSCGAILGGIVAAGAVIAVVEWAGHQMADQNASAPFAAALAGYGVGGLAGAVLARHLAPARAVAGWSVIGVLSLLAAINLFAFPHPDWFAPLAITILGLAGWTAAQIRP